MSATDAWELIFLMFVLKLPIVYLIAVVVWAIRADPEPQTAALVPAAEEPAPRPCPWHAYRRRSTRPPRGGRRVVTTEATR